VQTQLLLFFTIDDQFPAIPVSLCYILVSFQPLRRAQCDQVCRLL
jgi:hypothetical protein